MAKAGFISATLTYERETAERMSELTEKLYAGLKELEAASATAKGIADVTEQAMFYKDSVLPVMASMRAAADELEEMTPPEFWPYPSYGEMLSSID